MDEATIYYPPHRFGLIFHGVLILILVGAGIWGLWQAVNQRIGLIFLILLLSGIILLILVPMFVYRAFALWRASYLLERDGIRLRWGLREEVIPMDVVDRVLPVQELKYSLPLPWGRWPGAVLGVRRLPDKTRIEFMAAQAHDLILITTLGRVFAISPEDPEEFLLAYQRFAELGSLTPLPARSVYPTFLMSRVWAARPARYLLLTGASLSLAVLVVVSLFVPMKPTISLGFGAGGIPTEPVASARLLLLPILNSFFFLADLLLGLYFFRRSDTQVLSYLLWGSGVVLALLFLAALIYIL